MIERNPYADPWAALFKQTDADRAQDPGVIITTAPRRSVWCQHCAAYIRPDGIKSCLRKTCEMKRKV